MDDAHLPCGSVWLGEFLGGGQHPPPAPAQVAAPRPLALCRLSGWRVFRRDLALDLEPFTAERVSQCRSGPCSWERKPGQAGREQSIREASRSGLRRTALASATPWTGSPASVSAPQPPGRASSRATPQPVSGEQGKREPSPHGQRDSRAGATPRAGRSTRPEPRVMLLQFWVSGVWGVSLGWAGVQGAVLGASKPGHHPGRPSHQNRKSGAG